MKEVNADTRQRVLDVNRTNHDLFAENHDRAVPYIHRKPTRDFYWRLLSDAIAGNGGKWEGSRVIEIGCGTGTYADKVVENGGSYLGLDLSPKMIEQARRKYNSPKIAFECAALDESAAREENAADIVFSFSFLHHLPDIEAGLRQITSMLRGGGVYVALHEVNTRRRRTMLEKIDERLQSLCGYGVMVGQPLGERIIAAVRLRALSRWLPGVAAGAPAMAGNGPDYMDFQLNEPFSLRDRSGGIGKVMPYCYLAFVSLRMFSKPLNHEMLVLKKQ